MSTEQNSSYAIYLRKSRVDMEAEAHGQGDTLLRHRTRLIALAKSMSLPIVKIYQEVVSGDTITSRPQMQQLLHDVEGGLYAGVLVMEIERLARGDTIDQGLVARAFKYSGTKIITPVKTYDPLNEFDEEYFEFGLYMSRREYKTINRRQQAGRMASIHEGKWIANKAPYGYRRIKLDHQKGWTLEPDDHAPITQDIFRWYTSGDGIRHLGVSLIVRRLNDLGIPSPGGHDWTNCVVRTILSNPAYAGYVRWGNRSTHKSVDHGRVVISRPRRAPGDSCTLVRGLHPALVSDEIYQQAQRLLGSNASRPGPKQVETKNPLAGLIRCDQCGRAMVRRPYQERRKDELICPYTSCHTVGSDLDAVESAVLDSMRIWLSNFEAAPQEDTDAETAEQLTLTRSIDEADKELSRIDAQEQRAFDLVEQGTYTPDVFTSRMAELSSRRQDLLAKQQDYTDKLKHLEALISAKAEIAPAVRRVLDAYPLAQTPADKNDLLRSVLDHVDYHKATGGRWRESDLRITIFPKIPFIGNH